MDHDAAGTRSLWMDGVEISPRPPLERDAAADVCVVGAGLAGLLCAFELAGSGRRVIVLEAGDVGGGETGRTTAHLASAIDDRFYVIRDKHGPEAARIQAQSHASAVSRLESIAASEGIECEFSRVDGYLFLPPGGDGSILKKELSAAHEAGLAAVEQVASAPSFDSGSCLRFPDQGQFHPLRFLEGLARAVERRGGVIHGRTRVTGVHGKGPIEVRTEPGRRVASPCVIVATNSPITGPVPIHAKQEASRTYAVALEITPGSVVPALFWNTSQEGDKPHGPYHYVRVASSPSRPGAHDLLVVGGGDHRTGERGDSPDPWEALATWARLRWPTAGAIAYRWSGQVQEPHDHVAFLGPAPMGPEGLFIATGDSGMGMTHAAIASMVIPALITGQTDDRLKAWTRLYDPSRPPLRALGALGKHAATMAMHYADWLTPGTGADSIEPGQGRVVRKGLGLLAVHRDQGGTLHTRSAVCPHLGCIVQWNPRERSWDCPCHGSRFATDGRVLNSPACTPLKQADMA